MTPDGVAAPLWILPDELIRTCPHEHLIINKMLSQSVDAHEQTIDWQMNDGISGPGLLASIGVH